MNIKYYLRGLGIGILVTAAVLSISKPDYAEALSDEEIILRAKALGMTEDNMVLAELENGAGEAGQASAEPISKGSQTAEPISKGSQTAEPISKGSQTAEPFLGGMEAVESDSGEVPSEEPPVGSEEVAEPVSPPPADESLEDTKPLTAGMGLPAEDNKLVSVTVASGDSSYSISSKLEEAGLVTSASGFDTFLCDNEYDKYMRAGSYQIPQGADQETIAKIISGK